MFSKNYINFLRNQNLFSNYFRQFVKILCKLQKNTKFCIVLAAFLNLLTNLFFTINFFKNLIFKYIKMSKDWSAKYNQNNNGKPPFHLTFVLEQQWCSNLVSSFINRGRIHKIIQNYESTQASWLMRL